MPRYFLVLTLCLLYPATSYCFEVGKPGRICYNATTDFDSKFIGALAPHKLYKHEPSCPIDYQTTCANLALNTLVEVTSNYTYFGATGASFKQVIPMNCTIFFNQQIEGPICCDIQKPIAVSAMPALSKMLENNIRTTSATHEMRYDSDIMAVEGFIYADKDFWQCIRVAHAVFGRLVRPTPSISLTLPVTGSGSASETLSQNVSETASLTTSSTETITLSITLSETPTNSLSQSASGSLSLTNSATESASSTLSQTLTPTITLSITPTPTNTASVSSSVTDTFSTSLSMTVTISKTLSVSNSVSESISSTQSQTLTSSVSETLSPSATSTTSPTYTLSITPTKTLTLTTTDTVSNTATITPSESASVSLSGTRSPSATSTMSPSESLTVSPSATSSASGSPSVTPTVSGSGSSSAMPSISESQSVTPSVSSSNTKVPTPTHTKTKTLIPAANPPPTANWDASSGIFNDPTDQGGRYTVDNGVVTDTFSNLEWQQDHSSSRMLWDATEAYCASQNTGGFTDWRVPTVQELQLLVDYTIPYQGTAPGINSAAFPNTPLDYFWSSTPMADGLPQESYYTLFGKDACTSGVRGGSNTCYSGFKFLCQRKVKMSYFVQS